MNTRIVPPMCKSINKKDYEFFIIQIYTKAFPSTTAFIYNAIILYLNLPFHFLNVIKIIKIINFRKMIVTLQVI